MDDVNIDWPTARRLGLPDATISNDLYRTRAGFEAERDRVFAKSWLAIARVEEVVEANSYIVRELPPTRTSVIVARGRDNVVRAFYNQCSHRSVALVCQAKGKSNTFRCPYHAWTYATDGRLVAVPAEGEFPHVDKSKSGLEPISLDIWNGFIFVNLDPSPELSLREFLAGIGSLYDTLPFGDYPYYVEIVDTVESNWKTLMNAFGEGYHVPILHNKTLSPMVVTKDNPSFHYYDIRLFGPHSTSTVGRNYAWSPSTPVLNFAIMQMLPASVPDQEAIAAGRGITQHAGINAMKLENFGTENIILFPNVIFQPLANGYLWFRFWPLSENRMTAQVRLYATHEPRTLREKFAFANSVAATRDVLSEDMAMSRIQQKGIESGGKPVQVFGENEPLLRHFTRTLAEYLGEAATTVTR